MTKTIEIDFDEFKKPEMAQEYIVKELNLPAFYGKNLDDLSERMKTFDQEVVISISNYDALDYRENAIVVALKDAAKQNIKLTVKDEVKR